MATSTDKKDKPKGNPGDRFVWKPGDITIVKKGDKKKGSK